MVRDFIHTVRQNKMGSALKIWVRSGSGSKMGPKRGYLLDSNDLIIRKCSKFKDVRSILMIEMYDRFELLMNSKIQKCMINSNHDRKCKNFFGSKCLVVTVR